MPRDYRRGRPGHRAASHDERPGGRTVAPIVRRGTDPRRELERLAELMRSPGALAGVPVPPSLVELARKRAAEVTA